MARKKRKKTTKEPEVSGEKFLDRVAPATRRRIVSIILFVVTFFLIMSSLGLAGITGEVVNKALRYLFGDGFFIVAILMLIYSVLHVRSLHKEIGAGYLISAGAFILSILGFFDILFEESNAGGLIGSIVGSPLVHLFDIYLSLIILVAIATISGLIIFETSLNLPSFFVKLLHRFKKTSTDEDQFDDIVTDNTGAEATEEDATDEANEEKKESKISIVGLTSKKKSKSNSEITEDGGFVLTDSDHIYTPPPLSLLAKNSGKPTVGDIKASANIIKRTLMNFRIHVEIDEISIGPTVTRFALKPAEGVKLSRIVGLQNELSLALAAHPIRVEAPIPGKSLVGIEIPNKTKTVLGMGSILGEDVVQNAKHPLVAALGKGVSGKTFISNIAKMPHLLIAGATGSGKSVTVHTIVTSLLYRNGPESLRFIMVDPKRVELTLYNDIPHLLTPVIKNPKKAILALRWAAKEMERRYDVLETETVRDIASYHKNIVEPAYAKDAGKAKPGSDDEDDENLLPEKMPYIVIIIDELADIMQAYPKELESAIVRLAQMSRAVGIHLILSTQRPEVNVITGLIKANVPGRIALRVASQIDSRTILDSGGAEKLLGAGDMLFQSGNMAQPVRMQGTFISEGEVKKVVKFIKKHSEDIPPDEINLSDTLTDGKTMHSSSLDDDDSDELYEDARETVMRAGKASTSYLQRKLRVGYARAARLMDMLEEHGVIGPANGSKPREVLEQGPTDDPMNEHHGESPEYYEEE